MEPAQRRGRQHDRAARLDRAEATKEAFVRLSRKLAGALSYKGLMGVLREETDRLLHWDVFYLAHRLPDQDRFQIVGVVDTVKGRKKSFPGKDNGPAQFSPSIRQVLEGRPLLANRGPDHPEPLMAPAGTDRRAASLMFVPVRRDGDVIGVLTAQSYTSGRYGQADLTLLQDFADAAAPALERVRAEEAFRRSQALLALERDLALTLSSTSDLKLALDRSLEISLQIEGIDCGGAYVIDQQNGDLHLVCHRGLSDEFIENVGHVVADSRRAELIALGKPLYVPRAQLHALDADCRREGLRALACVPVMFGGRPIAALNLASRKLDEFPADARSGVEAIAAQMGAVIVRIRAEEALREARDLLERRVEERTAELLESNQRLQAEIARREQTQQALADSEQKHRLLIETNAIGYVILDEQGRVVDANQEYVRITGRLNLDEILGRPVTDWTAEQDAIRNAEEVRRCLRQGFVRGLEIAYRTPSGEFIPVEIDATVVLTQDGTRILSLVRDIGDRKRTEQDLRESEMKYRTVIETTGTGYVVVDLAGRVLDANDEYVRLSGHDSQADILGRPVTDWTAPHDRERNAHEVALCAEEGTVRQLEIDYIDRGGRITPVEVNATSVQTAEGAVIIGICRDITDRKRAGASLRAKEEQLRVLSENLAEGMVYQVNTGPDGQRRQFTYVSPAVERLHGLKVEDCLRDPSLLYGQFLEEDRALVAEHEARAIAAGRTFDVDARVRLPSGEIRWRRLMSSPHVHSDGTTVWDGIELDITERKRAEEALKESEARYRALVENSLVGIGITEADHILYANKALMDMFGYDDCSEFASKDPLDCLAPDSRQFLVELRAKRARGEEVPSTFEVDIVRKDGQIRTLQVATAPVPLGDRKWFYSSFIDVTERKRVEDALRRSEAHMRNLLASLPLVVYSVEPGTNKLLLFHGAVQQIFGMDPQVILENTDAVKRLVHPMHVERIAETWRKGLALGEPFELEVPIVRETDGQTRWLYERVVPLVDDQGRSLGHHGLVLDITERKRVEDALRRKEKELRRFGIEANRQLEQDRARISRELHDELGQMLTALNLNLAWLDGHTRSGDPAVMERLAESIDYVSRMITSVRSLAKSLRPAALSHHGLVEAVRAHVSEFEQYAGISCKVSVVPRNLEVAEPVATTAFRIIQEALTNVARHSRATCCYLGFQLAGDCLLVTVRDDGVGLRSTDLASLRSLGIAGMRERAAILGGRVTVENAPGGGVCVTARVPLSGEKSMPPAP